MEQLKQQLQTAGILYKENEPLSAHCTFRIGGPADLFVMPRDEDQLCQTVQFCKQAEIRYYLLGNGSNILFADEGFRGAVIDVSAVLYFVGYRRSYGIQHFQLRLRILKPHHRSIRWTAD